MNNVRSIKERVDKRVADLLKTRGGGRERAEYLRKCVRLIDLMNLKSAAYAKDIVDLCKMARRFRTAAVCVNPIYVKKAREALDEGRGNGGEHEVKLAAVAGGFPLSQTPIEIKVVEIERVREDGADEIDIVLNQGAFLSGDYETVRRELRAMREAAGETHLKVILENCELKDPKLIRLASEMAIEEGADFIKTSTGFGKYGSKFEDVVIMLMVIKEVYEASGKKIGMKPAGGLATAEDALTYAFLVEDVLGKDWLNAELIRYGASSLLMALVNAIELYYGTNPDTGWKTDALLGPGRAEPTIEHEFPCLIPWKRPDALMAGFMADQLIECIGRTEQLPETAREMELLRIARFLSAEAFYSIDDAVELIDVLKTNGVNRFIALAAEKQSAVLIKTPLELALPAGMDLTLGMSK